MTEAKTMNVGVIGAGMISDIYLTNMINRFPQLTVCSITSRNMTHAREKAQKYGLQAVTVDELLADPKISIVVVLTPVGSHYELIRAALNAGKHVYTEKTITDDLAQARELAELAESRGLYLCSAPDTFLGSALQTARKAIDDGILGDITSFTLAANRDNTILINFFPFLREKGAGICLDYGVYYLTALVSLLGPAAEAAAYVRSPYPVVKNINPASGDFGGELHNPNESEVSAILRLKSGVCGTFLLNADSIMQDQARFYIYGTKGILTLTDPNGFGGDVVLLTPDAEDPYRRPLVNTVLAPVNPYSDNCRGVGPAEMADAIVSGRKGRTDCALAIHVLDVLEAILASGGNSQFIPVSTTCERPEPFLQLS